jgi:hypothetical protein
MLQSISYEVNTDRRDIAFRICIIGKSQKQARLSYTGVPNKEELEKVIVSVRFVSIAVESGIGQECSVVSAMWLRSNGIRED